LTHLGQKNKIYTFEKESFFNNEVVKFFVPDNDAMEEIAFIISSKYVGEVIICKNITSFHELDEARIDFMVIISHEFKTPISSTRN
jgi:NtrC-family two-component system sensor histidine kinase KinB